MAYDRLKCLCYSIRVKEVVFVVGALEGGALGGGGGGGALGALRAPGSPPAPSLGASRHSLIGKLQYLPFFLVMCLVYLRNNKVAFKQIMFSTNFKTF